MLEYLANYSFHREINFWLLEYPWLFGILAAVALYLNASEDE